MSPRLQNIQARVGSLTDADASGLVAVPGIENDAVASALRKIEIQIFELADALADLRDEVDGRGH